jgi:hypothetical protein
MCPADLRRAVTTTPFRMFRLWLASSDWPIVCGYADDWCISPSGKFLLYVDRDRTVHVYTAAEISRVEYMEES